MSRISVALPDWDIKWIEDMAREKEVRPSHILRGIVSEFIIKYKETNK